MGYRKKYETYHNTKLSKDYDVHHIDWNHNNNNIDNLIAIPRTVHKIIHKHGFMDRNEINKLVSFYKKQKTKL